MALWRDGGGAVDAGRDGWITWMVEDSLTVVRCGILPSEHVGGGGTRLMACCMLMTGWIEIG